MVQAEATGLWPQRQLFPNVSASAQSDAPSVTITANTMEEWESYTQWGVRPPPNQTAAAGAARGDAGEAGGGGVSELAKQPAVAALVLFSYAFVFGVGLVGNVLVVLVVLRRRTLHTITNTFCCNLAIADVMVRSLPSPLLCSRGPRNASSTRESGLCCTVLHCAPAGLDWTGLYCTVLYLLKYVLYISVQWC